jgi:hypothetical protein
MCLCPVMYIFVPDTSVHAVLAVVFRFNASDTIFVYENAASM